MNYLYSLQSEWLKTKRSAAAWLCLLGGFFIPVIYLVAAFKNHHTINEVNHGNNIWQNHFNMIWQNMAGFLLPMGVILASSLVAQMEYKNNTWKLVHTTPQPFTLVFISKFSVILLLTIQFFLFFNIGIVLSAVIPSLILDHRLPDQPIPYLFFIKGNIKFFIACLPILALQYLISLQFKNFLVSIGIGFLLLIGTAIGLSWKFIYLSPYSYGPLNMLAIRHGPLNANVHLAALAYFLLIMVVSYFLYIRKKEKG